MYGHDRSSMGDRNMQGWNQYGNDSARGAGGYSTGFSGNSFGMGIGRFDKHGGGNFASSGRASTHKQGEKLTKPKWDQHSLVPFRKNFWNMPAKANMEEVGRYRASKEITVHKGQNVPDPITRFEDGCFPDYVMKEIQNQGFLEPTAIQAQGM